MAGASGIDDDVGRIVDAVRRGAHEELTMYDALAPVYDYLYGGAYDYDLQAEYVTRALPDDAAVDVLEAGCGTGRLLEALARRRPDATLSGVDLHPRMLGIARDRLRGTDRATVSQGDALELDGAYDAVAAFNLLPHFGDDDLRAFFETAAALLPPDGALAFDYKDPRDEVNGAYDRWRTETDEYEILTRFVTVYDEGQSYYAVSYQFVDRSTGEAYSTSELMAIHFQTPDLIEARLDAAGFDRVETFPGVGDQSGIVVARPAADGPT